MFAASSCPAHAPFASQSRCKASKQPCVRCRDGKMYVPSDSFGGLSPEKKASQALETLLTFTAAKIVLAQLEGSGRGALAAYNQQGYAVLARQLQEVSLRDPDAWLDDLLKRDKGIALRLMEVRAAYATTDFEWDQLQRLSVKAIKDSNLALMRKAATASLQATQPAAAAAAAAAVAAGAAEQQDSTQAAAAAEAAATTAAAPEAPSAPAQSGQQQKPTTADQQQQQQVGAQGQATTTSAAAAADDLTSLKAASSDAGQHDSAVSADTEAAKTQQHETQQQEGGQQQQQQQQQQEEDQGQQQQQQ